MKGDNEEVPVYVIVNYYFKIDAEGTNDNYGMDVGIISILCKEEVAKMEKEHPWIYRVHEVYSKIVRSMDQVENLVLHLRVPLEEAIIHDKDDEIGEGYEIHEENVSKIIHNYFKKDDIKAI